MDSQSLVGLLTSNSESHRDHVVSALSSGARDWRLIEDERYKLVLEVGVPAVLYDRWEDPWETCDFSHEAPMEVQRLHGILASLSL